MCIAFFSRFMRTECINHQYAFDKPMPVTRLMDHVSNSKTRSPGFVHSTMLLLVECQVPTQRYGRRPFGVGFLMAGFDVRTFNVLALSLTSPFLGERHSSVPTVSFGELLLVQIDGYRRSFSIGSNLSREELGQVRWFQSRWIDQTLHESFERHASQRGRTDRQSKLVWRSAANEESNQTLELCGRRGGQRHTLRYPRRCTYWYIHNSNRRWWACTARRSRRYFGKDDWSDPLGCSHILFVRSRWPVKKIFQRVRAVILASSLQRKPWNPRDIRREPDIFLFFSHWFNRYLLNRNLVLSF